MCQFQFGNTWRDNKQLGGEQRVAIGLAAQSIWVQPGSAAPGGGGQDVGLGAVWGFWEWGETSAALGKDLLLS